MPATSPRSRSKPLPELSVVGLDMPPVMQPGDTIQPNIRIANFGPGSTASQGTLQVALIASTTPTFNSGSSLVATYTVANIPGQTPARTSATAVFGDANLDPAVNVVTIAGAAGHAPGLAGQVLPGRRDRPEQPDQGTREGAAVRRARTRSRCRTWSGRRSRTCPRPGWTWPAGSPTFPSSRSRSATPSAAFPADAGFPVSPRRHNRFATSSSRR